VLVEAISSAATCSAAWRSLGDFMVTLYGDLMGFNVISRDLKGFNWIL